MATKLYLHDAASAVGGTLPGGSTLSSTVPDVTAAGASTNRSMSTTIGALQASGSYASAATSATQTDWIRRFISDPLDVNQTIDLSTAGDIVLHTGYQQSNTNGRIAMYLYHLCLWRPTTGAVVSDIISLLVSGTQSWTPTDLTNTTQQWADGSNGNDQGGGGSFSGLAGDVFVAEIWGRATQGAAMSYTITCYYDGTTESSTTSAASYIAFPNDTVTFAAAAAGYQPRHGFVNFVDPGVL